MYQSIFSSQLIHVSETGAVSVVSGSWWFVVVSAPLTIVTFLLWRYWLYYSIKKGDTQPKKSNPILEKDPGHHIWHNSRGLEWYNKMLAKYTFAARNRRGGLIDERDGTHGV